MNVVGVEGVTSDGGRFSDKADFVVVATPASIAARIVETAAPELSCALRRIVYRPVATVVATYASATFPGSAGGLFLPRGATASHISKQGSKGTTLRYSFAGVAARKLLASRSSLETLLDEGEHTFKEVGGRIGERLRHTGRIWLEGHCAQSWMHHQTMKSIMTHVGQVRGLAVAGDYFQSNSLEGCALSARRSVAEALSRMKT
jgi:predicted NAD/FAD-dependent oxidoreductase